METCLECPKNNREVRVRRADSTAETGRWGRSERSLWVAQQAGPAAATAVAAAAKSIISGYEEEEEREGKET